MRHVSADENIEDNTSIPPLMTIWCVAHRSNLAWKSVSESLRELKHIVVELVTISSFFHTSGLHTREFKNIAEEKNLNCMKLPKLFEQICCFYFQITKKIAADSLTVTHMDKLTKNILEPIDLLKTQNLLGGWLYTLELQIENREEELYLKCIKLHTTERCTKQYNKYVTDKRDKREIIHKIRESLREFLSQRFILDIDTINILKQFVELSQKSNIEQVHKILCYDLDLQLFNQEYQEFLMAKNTMKYRNMKLSDLIKLLCTSNEYCNLKIALVRIMAAKPSSADVERLISASNKLKTSDRARILVETENYYLYNHYNISALVNWDVRKAVIHFMKMKERRNTNRSK
ncbi:hypothetical protein QTP88_023952 [Uroleucon formosanum]